MTILRLKLTGEQIDGDPITCTGVQLEALLRVLAVPTADCTWFATDVHALQSLSPQFQRTEELVQVGSTDEFATLAATVSQFLSGVFLAVPVTYLPPVWKHPFFTEDSYTTDLSNARVEIRVFDTSYFEIYTAEPDVLEGMLKRFGGTIETNG